MKTVITNQYDIHLEDIMKIIPLDGAIELYWNIGLSLITNTLCNNVVSYTLHYPCCLVSYNFYQPSCQKRDFFNQKIEKAGNECSSS